MIYKYYNIRKIFDALEMPAEEASSMPNIEQYAD